MKATVTYVAVLQHCQDRAAVWRYRQDWIERYVDHMKGVGIEEPFARQCAEAAAEMESQFADSDWDDPADAADDEMSYWGD